MINLTIGNSSKTERTIVDPNSTVIQLCEEHQIDWSRAQVMVNGVTLTPGQIEMSLAELGCKEVASIFVLDKLTNA